MECFFLLLFLGLMVSAINDKYAKLYVLPVLFISIAIFFGFREGYGTDYFNYVGMAELLKQQPHLSYVGGEPGFRAAILLFNQLGMPEYSILSVSFLVTIACIAISSYRFSPSATISLIIVVSFGFLFASFNVVRQALAFSLICTVLHLLRNEKYVLFSFVCVLVAYLFHNSVILLALIPWFRFINLSPNIWTLIVLSTIPLMQVNNVIFDFIGSLLDYEWFVYAGYFDSEWSVTSRANTYLNSMVRVVIALWIVSRMKIIQRDKLGSILLNAYLIGFCFQVVFIDIQAFNRLALVFTWLSFLVIPMAVMSYQRRSNRAITMAALLSYSAVLIFISVSGHVKNFDIGSHLF